MYSAPQKISKMRIQDTYSLASSKLRLSLLAFEMQGRNKAIQKWHSLLQLNPEEKNTTCRSKKIKST